MSAFGFELGATNVTTQLTAYDAADNVLETLAIPKQVATLPYPFSGFYGLASSTANIAKFSVTSVGDNWSLDDLQYKVGTTVSPTPVPEPGTAGLLGLSVLGGAFIRRRRLA